jgi:hypothetical protein
MVRSSGILAMLDEIEKCVVLCSNCHRKMHAESARKKAKKKPLQKLNNRVT